MIVLATTPCPSNLGRANLCIDALKAPTIRNLAEATQQTTLERICEIKTACRSRYKPHYIILHQQSALPRFRSTCPASCPRHSKLKIECRPCECQIWHLAPWTHVRADPNLPGDVLSIPGCLNLTGTAHVTVELSAPRREPVYASKPRCKTSLLINMGESRHELEKLESALTRLKV